MEQEKKQFVISEVMKLSLDKMVYWGKLFGIVGFVAAGLMVFSGVFMFFMPSSAMPEYSWLGVMEGALGIFYIAFAAFYYFPSKYMYDFSVQGRRALHGDVQNEIEKAFSNLGKVFKFWGVLTVVIIGIYATILLGALFAGLLA